MNQGNLRIGGAVCFWSLAPASDRQRIHEGLSDIGLAELTPNAPSMPSRLRNALSEVYTPPNKKTRYVVRPIKDGFAVVSEAPGETYVGSEWGTVIATATLTKDCDLRLSPYDPDKGERILRHVRESSNVATAASAGKALVATIEHLGGVALRPNGGVYWLNDAALDKWSRVAEAYENASLGGKTSMLHVMRVVADEQMVRAVGEALESEIAAASTAIENEVNSGSLSAAACEHRVVVAGRMLSKVKAYEAAFGQSLDTIREHINRIAAAAAMASLQASAAAVGGSQPLAFAAA